MDALVDDPYAEYATLDDAPSEDPYAEYATLDEEPVPEPIIEEPVEQAPPVEAAQPLEIPEIDDGLPWNQATRDEALRNTLIGGGGTYGAYLGTPAGPPGVALGGALGSAAGYALFGAIKSDSPMDILEGALAEGKIDLIFSLGAQGVRPAVQALGLARRKMLGIGEEELKHFYEGQKFGVDLSPTDISKFGWVKGSSKVVGKFPFLGTPFKESGVRKAHQVVAQESRLLHRLGPSMTVAEMGVDLNQSAFAKYKMFREEANRLYRNARRIANESGAVIPTSTIKKVSRLITEQAEVAKAGRRTQKVNPLLDVLESAKVLPDNITGSQLDDFASDLDVAMGAAKTEGFDISRGMTVKKALERDLRRASNPDLRDAIKSADTFYAKTITTFETPTAQKFNRVTKNAFKVKLSKPGTFREDELFRVAFNARSPQAMSDLRDLIGKKSFKKAVKLHIEQAFEASKNPVKEGREAVDVFNPRLFIKKLGLSKPNSPEFEALSEALSGTGLEADDLVRFANVADDAFSTEIPDVSTFIARRATLGGARAALRGLIPGLAVAAPAAAVGNVSIPVAVLVTLSVRRGMTVLSNPKTLKLATLALDKEAAIALRRNAAMRLVRLHLSKIENEPKQTSRGTRSSVPKPTAEELIKKHAQM